MSTLQVGQGFTTFCTLRVLPARAPLLTVSPCPCDNCACLGFIACVYNMLDRDHASEHMRASYKAQSSKSMASYIMSCEQCTGMMLTAPVSLEV